MKPRKIDILSTIILSEIIALIFLGISSTLNLPAVVLKFAKLLPLALPVLSLIAIYIAFFLARFLPVILQLAKFLLVGVANTFVDLGVLNLIMFLTNIAAGWHYPLFKAISFSCSIVHSFFWNKFWTFQKKEAEGAGREFGQFYLIAGIGFFLNIGIASFIVNIIGPQFGLSAKLWANFGAICSAVCVALWNFLGYKFIVFKK